MKKSIVLIITVLILVTFSIQIQALEAGGEIGLNYTGVIDKDGNIDGELTETLNLELFIPKFNNTEFRYEFLVTKPIQDLLKNETVNYFTKKLYVKHKYDNFHLTLGRQPVSWSFGSLLNPIDYTPGASALNNENNSKYTDAVEAYIPINWNSNISVVTSFPGGFSTNSEEMKWGLRSRVGYKGYDLTFNYVREPENIMDQIGQTAGIPINSVIPAQRFGLSVKGDIKDLGIYGAYGYYFEEDIDNSKSYLLGADYSYNINYYTKISMQLEYLGLEIDSLEPQLRKSLLKMDTNDKRLDLLTGSINYPIDDFSSIGLMAMANLDDSSILLSPNYHNTLPGNIDLTLSAIISTGNNASLFSDNGILSQRLISVDLSYPF